MTQFNNSSIKTKQYSFKNRLVIVLTIFIVFTVSVPNLFSQINIDTEKDFQLMFYNVENLFDIYDDSITVDEEFLPKGNHYWSSKRFWTKINQIAKVTAIIGQGEMPDIIGVCEIENRYVLEKLTKNTGLKNYNYGIIHKDSPDFRGIDVGLLYRKSTFYPLSYEAIRINFKNEPNKKTRDLLYVQGKILSKHELLNDTLHIFINHWPSRRGGQMLSETYRLQVAQVLRSKVDSLFNKYPKPNIIIMGDFNDYIDNKSIKETLGAQTDFQTPENSKLYNLSYYLSKQKDVLGTHKIFGHWGILDQIIVSGGLLQEQSVYTRPEMAHIFISDFLLEEDEAQVGKKPKRTYIGMKYNGGFSDHLPVYLNLKFSEK